MRFMWDLSVIVLAGFVKLVSTQDLGHSPRMSQSFDCAIKRMVEEFKAVTIVTEVERQKQQN